MTTITLRRFATVLLVPAALALGACERSTTGPDDEHNEFHTVEVIDRGQTSRPVVATWVAGQGWTGSIPSISLSSTNQRISIGFRVLSSDGDELELSEDDESIRYALATGAPQGVIDTSHPDNVLFHGDHVHIYGLAPGTTQVQFILWHIDHADDATDAIQVTVVD